VDSDAPAGTVAGRENSAHIPSESDSAERVDATLGAAADVTNPATASAAAAAATAAAARARDDALIEQLVLQYEQIGCAMGLSGGQLKAEPGGPDRRGTVESDWRRSGEVWDRASGRSERDGSRRGMELEETGEGADTESPQYRK
jgi:hypothetical protein